MKKATILTALCILFPISAFAHGSTMQQATAAIEKSGQLFSQAQPKEIQRLFKSVTATRIGHERFSVAIVLSNQNQISYICSENEDVEPVVWECEAK